MKNVKLIALILTTIWASLSLSVQSKTNWGTGTHGFPAATERIVEAHSQDFNETNFNTFIASKGGLISYIHSLGGVFASWNGTYWDVKTESEMQRIMQIVYGLCSIWGVDYGNGGRHVDWMTNNGTTGRFYTGDGAGKGYYGGYDINTMLMQGKWATNCNYMVDLVMNAAGLFGDGHRHLATSKGLGYTSVDTVRSSDPDAEAQLKCGDVLNFYNSSGKWHHCSIVYKMHNGKAEIWDTGSRWIGSGNVSFDMSAYNGDTWVAYRYRNLKTDEELGLTAKDESYQLASADDMKKFADLVDNGYTGISGTMTADIDYSGHDLFLKKTTAFTGCFDGGGHTLTINLNDAGTKTTNLALFPKLAGTVRNLELKGRVSSANNNTGSVCGNICGASYLENITSFVDITNTKTSGSANAGGFAGYQNSEFWMDNCAFKGSITASSGGVGGFVGWSTGKVAHIKGAIMTGTVSAPSNAYPVIRISSSNLSKQELSSIFYKAGTFTDSDGISIAVTDDEFKTGRYTYMLNAASNVKNVWAQTIGTDLYPMLNSKSLQVFACGELRCDSAATDATTFSNTQGDVFTTEHHFGDDGLCTICGQLQKDDEDYLVISSLKALQTFASLVNHGETSLNGRLTQDIDFTGCNELISRDVIYTGIFDGGCHTIQINMSNTAEWGGLFPRIGKRCTIKNLVVKGSFSTSKRKSAPVVGYVAPNSSVRFNKIISDVDITSTYSSAGDTDLGGIVGRLDNDGGIYAFLYDCAFTGSMTAANKRVGGLIGCSNSTTSATSSTQNNVVYIYNSYVSGSITTVDGDDVSNIIAGWGGCAHLSNVYYKTGKLSGLTNATTFTDAQQQSGELCYKLNGTRTTPVWFQDLAADAYPVFSGKTVYYNATLNPSYYNDEPTGIHRLNADNVLSDGIYFDLQGRRVNHPLKGNLYILNGRKVLFR